MKKHTAILVVLIAFTGCGAPKDEPAPNAPQAADATPTPAPDPALARADALLADMQKKEAEYKKLERELPKAVAPTAFYDQSRPAGAPPTGTTAAAAAPAASPASAALAGAPAQDETYWKERARALQQKLEEAERNAAAAAVALDSTTLRITQDQARAEYLARLAAVGNIKAEIERFREDGRRANVPSGWLRWP